MLPYYRHICESVLIEFRMQLTGIAINVNDFAQVEIQFKVLPSCLAKSSDLSSALLKYYANIQVFNVQLN